MKLPIRMRFERQERHFVAVDQVTFSFACGRTPSEARRLLRGLVLDYAAFLRRELDHLGPIPASHLRALQESGL